MHRLTATIVAMALAAGLPAQADPAGESATPPEVLALYPKAAMAAGIGGFASLNCAYDEHLKPNHCSIWAEVPAGQGFGQAALALAALFPPDPTAHARPEPAGDYIIFNFSAKRGSIEPNPLAGPHHWTVGPSLARQPTQAEKANVYPQAALARGVSGGAVMNCLVQLDGTLSDCTVSDERPANEGFGTARSRSRRLTVSTWRRRMAPPSLSA